MIPATLAEVLETFDLTFAAIADLQTGTIKLIGKPESVDNTDLITSLFADNETVQSLNRSLKGQLLPRIWNQGEVSCIVCKPTESILVGLFVNDDLSPVEQYRWSKEANEAIQKSFLGTQ